MHVSRSKGDVAVLVTSFLQVSALHYRMSRDPRCRLQICWCCWHLSYWGVDLLTCRQRMVRLKTLWERWPWCFFHFCICHNLSHIVTNSGSPQVPVEWMVTSHHPPEKKERKWKRKSHVWHLRLSDLSYFFNLIFCLVLWTHGRLTGPRSHHSVHVLFPTCLLPLLSEALIIIWRSTPRPLLLRHLFL